MQNEKEVAMPDFDVIIAILQKQEQQLMDDLEKIRAAIPAMVILRNLNKQKSSSLPK